MTSTLPQTSIVTCLAFLGECLIGGVSQAVGNPCFTEGSDRWTTSEFEMDKSWNAESDLDAALKVALSHSD